MKAFITPIIILCALVPVVSAQESKDLLPHEVRYKLSKLLDDTGYSISQAIFSSIEDISTTLYSNNNQDLKFGIKRKIFDNQDVLNTYSVFDSLSLQLKNYIEFDDVIKFAPSFGLNLKFEANPRISLLNVRQVKASKLATLPSIDDSFPGEIRDVQTYTHNDIRDNEIRPRLSNLVNPLKMPFKIPSQFSKIENIGVGELFSYSYEGYIQLSASFLLEHGVVPLKFLENSYGVFIKGKFQVSVLRDTATTVKVKITKVKERGHMASATVGKVNFDILEGIILFKGSSYELPLKAKVELVPFEMSYRKTQASIFDEAYSFDLSMQEARHAYQKAFWGSFFEAQSLDEKKGVRKLFIQDTVKLSNERNVRVKLLVFNKDRFKNSIFSSSRIIIDDKEYEVHRLVSALERKWKFIQYKQEVVRENVSVISNKELIQKGSPSGINIQIEKQIDDTHTTGKEMAQYSYMFHKGLSRNDIVPNLPLKLPLVNIFGTMKQKRSIARYKRSKFIFGVRFNGEHLLKFQSISDNEKWSFLERAFSVSSGSWSSKRARRKYLAMYSASTLWGGIKNIFNMTRQKGADLLAARKIYKSWRKLQNVDIYQNSHKLNSLLKRMFQHKNFLSESMRLVYIVANDSSFERYGVVTNSTFGRVSFQKNVNSDYEDLLDIAERENDFSSQAGGAFNTSENIISEIAFNNDILSFHFSSSPKVVYFKIYEINPLSKQLLKEEFVYYNIDFSKGINKVDLVSDIKSSLAQKLKASLVPGNRFRLIMSTSSNLRLWSKTAQLDFKY